MPIPLLQGKVLFIVEKIIIEVIPVNI